MTDTARSEGIQSFAEHEHLDLVRGINNLHVVACAGHASSLEVRRGTDTIRRWIRTAVDPHMAWEDRWLYPQVEARAGTAWATASSRFDHQQLRRAAEHLSAVADPPIGTHPADGRDELRYALFAFEALLRAHLEREERFLIPLLAEPVNAARRGEIAAVHT